MDKVQENRIRRKLNRLGLRLVKSRRRDPDAIDYGGYMIVDQNNGHVFGAGVNNTPEATLAQVDEWIKEATKNE